MTLSKHKDRAEERANDQIWKATCRVQFAIETELQAAAPGVIAQFVEWAETQPEPPDPPPGAGKVPQYRKLIALTRRTAAECQLFSTSDWAQVSDAMVKAEKYCLDYVQLNTRAIYLQQDNPSPLLDGQKASRQAWQRAADECKIAAVQADKLGARPPAGTELPVC